MGQLNLNAAATASQLGRSIPVKSLWTFADDTLTFVGTGLPYHSYGNPAAANTPGPQNFNLVLPFRGGKNTPAKLPTPVDEGLIGIWLNGVSMFNPSAAMGAPAGFPPPPRGFNYNASYTSGTALDYTFGEDTAGGHASPPNQYHYHDFSFEKAWTTGIGHISGSATSTGLAEVNLIPYLNGTLSHTGGHSKILGFALDGYPVYGPYGFSNSQDIDSPLRRMRTGYVLRDPSYRASTTAKDLQVWPLGIFIQDYEFIGNGDLDQHNGRYCVTPDYPLGTYAYFVTVDDNKKPVYPYVLGTSYYGDVLSVARFSQPLNLINRIKWLTPNGSLGTFKENTELNLLLEAASPVQTPLVFTKISGQLPPGVQLTPEGQLYGFPQVITPGNNIAREFSFTIRAATGSGLVSDRTFKISVNNIIPPVILPYGVRGEGIGYQNGNINLSFNNRGKGYAVGSVGAVISGADLDNSDSALPGYVYLDDDGSIKSVAITKPGNGYVNIPTISFIGANTVMASATITSLTTSGVEDLGNYFEGDPVTLQIQAQQVSSTGTLLWEVSDGIIPPGLRLSQTGLISGFPLAPPKAGPAGSAAYDVGAYDELVYDFEGASDNRKYQFTLRIFDGINVAYQKYRVGIYSRSYFLIDNILIDTDTTLYTADLDGFQYPSITTSAGALPPVRQLQSYAHQFQAYYSNPSHKVRWRINATGPALYDMGAGGVDDQNKYYDLVPFDGKSFDQADLSLPSGITLDTNTGWLIGTLGTSNVFKTKYQFDVIAYVDVQISATVTSRRESVPVRYTLDVMSDITDLITWVTPTNLGTIVNGEVSTVAVEAITSKKTPLKYKIKSGQYLRIPQGLKLLDNGLLSGRTTFDYFSLDRGVTDGITFDATTNTYDSTFSFTVIAYDETGNIYSEKAFALKVANINKRPYENIYLKALLPAGVRQVFRSIVTDPNLSSQDLIYRPNDPYFGVHIDMTMLTQAGLHANTASAYLSSMSNYHYDKPVNFTTIKKAVARKETGEVVYEVLYVEVSDYNDANTHGVTIGNSMIYSNSFSNMQYEIEQGIGYEYQGALPLWMRSIQPGTGVPLGFVRALVLAYAKAGQGDKLLYRYRASLQTSGYGVSDIMSTFSFTADRYQWDRTLSVNYDSATARFNQSQSTSFDRIPSLGISDRGSWIPRDSGSLTNLNSVAYAGSYGYVAVGDKTTILNSLSGSNWVKENSTISYTYAASLLTTVTAGNTQMYFPYSSKFSVGDEITRNGSFFSNIRSYITSVGNRVKLNKPLANTLPIGTSLWFVNNADGEVIQANLAVSASSGATDIFVDRMIMKIGNGVLIKGVDITQAAKVIGKASTTITLNVPLANLVPSGTQIKFDDLSGNVKIFATTGSSAEGSTTLTFASGDVSLIANSSYASHASIAEATLVQSQFSDIVISQGATTALLFNTQLDLAHRVTSASLAGTNVITLSSTDQIQVGAEVTPILGESNTQNTASWTGVTGTSLNILVPVADINGTVVRGQRVVAAGFPTASFLDDVVYETQNSISYANLFVSFPSTTIVSQSNASVSFISPTIIDTGTRVIAKTSNTITLNTALLANLNVGADSLIGFGLTDVVLNQVISDGSQWLAVGDRGLIINKPFDQAQWRQRYGLVYGDLKAIGYRSYSNTVTGPLLVNYVYVAVGNEGTIIRSTDVENWSLPIVTLANQTLRSVYYANGAWVAVGDQGQIVTSLDDGLSWTLDVATTSYDLRSVAYLGGRWIAVGTSGTILVKTLITDAWSKPNSGVTDELESVSFVNGGYLVVGGRGTILTSLDSSKWVQTDRVTSSRLKSVTRDSAQPVAVGYDGVIFNESATFTVDFSIRGISFQDFNFAKVDAMAKRGYRVSNGDLLIFAQQEGFGQPNDGWNQVLERFNGNITFGMSAFSETTVVPGYTENLFDVTVPNKRAGVWRVSVDTNNVITLDFVRQINLGQLVTVKNEVIKLVYDPVVAPGNTVPTYKVYNPTLADSTENTSFDGEGTRFSSNRDNYNEPGTLDKYLKFPKTGVFR